MDGGVKVSYADEQGNHVLTHTIIKSNHSVAIIVRKNGQIALIQQFRSTTGQNYVEIPAGVINDGESEEAAAFRKTREETGLLVFWNFNLEHFLENVRNNKKTLTKCLR